MPMRGARARVLCARVCERAHTRGYGSPSAAVTLSPVAPAAWRPFPGALLAHACGRAARFASWFPSLTIAQLLGAGVCRGQHSPRSPKRGAALRPPAPGSSILAWTPAPQGTLDPERASCRGERTPALRALRPPSTSFSLSATARSLSLPLFLMVAVPALRHRGAVALLRCVAVAVPLCHSGIVGHEHSRGGAPAVWPLFYGPLSSWGGRLDARSPGPPQTRSSTKWNPTPS